jgi:hypothetical protein
MLRAHGRTYTRLIKKRRPDDYVINTQGLLRKRGKFEITLAEVKKKKIKRFIENRIYIVRR